MNATKVKSSRGTHTRTQAAVAAAILTKAATAIKAVWLACTSSRPMEGKKKRGKSKPSKQELRACEAVRLLDVETKILYQHEWASQCTNMRIYILHHLLENITWLSLLHFSYVGIPSRTWCTLMADRRRRRRRGGGGGLVWQLPSKSQKKISQRCRCQLKYMYTLYFSGFL